MKRAAKEGRVARPPEPFPGQASSSSASRFHARPAKTDPAQFFAAPKICLRIRRCEPARYYRSTNVAIQVPKLVLSL